MKILYIENHDIFAETVAKIFLSKYEVNIVPTVLLAKKLLSEGHYDIALIDYDLDDGKGDEIASWIRLHYPSIKIIATSSHAEGNEKIKTAGADEICAKDNFANINNKIKSLLITL